MGLVWCVGKRLRFQAYSFPPVVYCAAFPHNCRRVIVRIKLQAGHSGLYFQMNARLWVIQCRRFFHPVSVQNEIVVVSVAEL